MKINAWSISEIGHTRKSNQDYVGQFPELNLFIVADGMGGHADGDVASRMAVEVIHAFVSSAAGIPGGASDPDCLSRAVESANRRIHEEGERTTTQQSSTRPLGTTVVALKVDLDACRAFWVHVGDSRLYRLRDRELTLLTADHTLFGQEYWGKDSIPINLPHTNRLVQALGINEHVEASAGCDAIVAGDLYLLCSDGVSGQLDAAVMQRELTATDSLQEAGEALIRRSLDAGGRDNASAVLVRVLGN
ncbi:MAG: PP2C family protein-serine/threonine phosphatase [Candidatus Binatia bacterium]